MREIRFRGKQIDTGQWIYGDLVHWNRLGMCAILPQEGDEWHAPIDFRVEPKTVGQFIGENDKNGVEIYEGDLLKYPGYAIYLEVVFSQKEYRFKLAPNCGIVPYLHDKDLEIIGNIIDNPELS